MRTLLIKHPASVDTSLVAAALDPQAEVSAPLNAHQEQLRRALVREHQAVLLPLLFISDLREWELHH